MKFLRSPFGLRFALNTRSTLAPSGNTRMQIDSVHRHWIYLASTADGHGAILRSYSRSGSRLEMARPLLTGIARQRIGVALSRRLLEALSSPVAELACSPADIDAARRAAPQPSATGVSADQAVLALSFRPEPRSAIEFSLYSHLVDTVPVASLFGSKDGGGNSPMPDEGDKRERPTNAGGGTPSH